MKDNLKPLELWPGEAYPLGATVVEGGINFAIYSEHATSVTLCLFDAQDNEQRIALKEVTAFVWHGLVRGVGPGVRYGYRVDGPYEPEQGLRFNPNNVLLCPYARAIDGRIAWDAGAFAYEPGADDLVMNTTDSRGTPLGVVVDPSFDWQGDKPPRIGFHELVIYEAHVKGLTVRHPEVSEEERGTYAGLASPPVVEYLKRLGINAIELMPIHRFVHDKFLLDKGLSNYGGYNTLGFFAPHERYRTGTTRGSEVNEFKTMVRTLHKAGIEVILDVVYNHTAEGNHMGPTFSFKGIDNPTYYRLVPDNPRFYFDYTGTGNSLNVRHPQTLQMLMDSLRYWITEMHVDGFRFDLAATLARGLHDVDMLSGFFTIIQQDPVISQVKLIAEPWDVGDGGYQVGNFPTKWAEWNGRYRDDMRAFWAGHGGKAGDIGYRLTGSSDLYENNGRRPFSSINLITAHDGFTLRDLVSYDHKHNEANGEDNKDGADDNISWNCGAEGHTDDEEIRKLRARQQKNMLATLLLSQGTPMIVSGDEYGRTQNGNNNAYCQDNEISWFAWDWDGEQKALFAFAQKVIALRREHPVLHRAKFFKNRAIRDTGGTVRDLMWFRHDGAEMSDEDWTNPQTQSLAMFIAGHGVDDVDGKGQPLVDDDFLLVLNASPVPLEFNLPSGEWQVVVDTYLDDGVRAAGATAPLQARSLQLLQRGAAGRR